jgi:chemotaxis regulatin CheY-phosphate phosphatase CheZ
VQEERVVRGEPSDRFNVVQEQMAESRQNHEMLKELLKDEDFRELTGKVLKMQMKLEERRAT